MKNPTTVIIADDHPMFRSGVRQALERDPELKVLGEAGDGATALRMIREQRPTVAVLDVNMPKMSGLEVAKTLSKEQGAPYIILLTMFDDEEILNEAMDLGVKAYLLKESASVDIADAVRSAMEGRHFISPALTDKLLRRKEKQSGFDASHPGIDRLSPQEKKVLRLIAESRTSKEIARELFLSQKTVDNYRFKISEKLDLRGSYSLLKFALENKNLL
ncbi:MAG TPA: response regulator transcription factor [Bacteroidota bacterium]